MSEEPLDGGITNAGRVVRSGGHVLRPATPFTGSTHRFLRALSAAGFDGAPVPVGIDNDGRERLQYIEGAVPRSPYPAWSRTDEALVSIAELLRLFHDAGRVFDPVGLDWATDLADPAGGTVICHNDVELSNVVFRNGVAVAFIDFEFAAPGRPEYDLAQLIRLCCPIEHEVDQARMGWHPADHGVRARLAADAYGLDQIGRTELLAAIEDAVEVIENMARLAAERRGSEALAAMATTGGLEKYDRRREWWDRNRPSFAAALA